MSREELEQLKSSIDIVDVISLFTDLSRSGRNYKGKCLFHNDNSPSMVVSPQKQIFKCFGCGKSGDVISFLEEAGNTFKDVITILKGDKDVEGEFIKKDTKPKVQLAEFSYIKPLNRVHPDKFIHKLYGEPKNIYEYVDANGYLLGYVLRYEFEGKKHILPYNYGICVKEGWDYEYRGKGCGKFHKEGDIVDKYLGFGVNKPIYRADLLSKYPNATVLIVEGEKTCDFVNKLLKTNKVICITWQSGTNTVNQVDWSILSGRRVVLIPDNDYTHQHKNGDIKLYYEQPSPKAFKYIADTIKDSVDSLKWVKLKPLDSKPCGWDLADESDWEQLDIFNFIKENNFILK